MHSTSGCTSTPAGNAIKARLEAALGLPFTHADRIHRLRNGVQIFPAMLQAIDAARETIEFETFIYWSGGIADRMSRALVDAADRGVSVRVLLDGVGSLPMPPEVLERFESSSVHFQTFRRPGLFRLRRLDERTHRKILVCDRQVGFVGGVGIAEEWEGDGGCPEDWRDSHFRLEGDVARILRGAFYENWQLTETPESEWEAECLEPAASGPEEGERAVDGGVSDGSSADAMDPDVESPGLLIGRDVAVQVVSSRGGRRWSPACTMQHLLFDIARERVRVMTPYFVPTEDLAARIVQAARRGVKVQLLVPGPHIDHRLSLLAGQDLWSDLLNAGVEIHQYQPTFPHAKIATVDGRLSMVGSMNFNRRSAEKDDELLLNIVDDEVTAALDRDFDEDLRTSIEVDRDTDWPKRGLTNRVAAWWTRRVLGSEL